MANDMPLCPGQGLHLAEGCKCGRDKIGRELLSVDDVENVVRWARDPNGTAGAPGSYVYRSAQIITQVADQRDRSEAALRKLLADVQEARAWWRPSRHDDPRPPLASVHSLELDYLERLAREGLGEP